MAGDGVLAQESEAGERGKRMVPLAIFGAFDGVRAMMRLVIVNCSIRTS